MSYSVDTATAFNTTANAAGSSSKKSAMSTEDFLTLLVAQLQNQNPLDPTDANELLNQMVSFASYERQSDMSEALSDLSDTVSNINKTLEAIVASLDISA